MTNSWASAHRGKEWHLPPPGFLSVKVAPPMASPGGGGKICPLLEMPGGGKWGKLNCPKTGRFDTNLYSQGTCTIF